MLITHDVRFFFHDDENLNVSILANIMTQVSHIIGVIYLYYLFIYLFINVVNVD
jgi:hypothetical protein